MEGVTSGAKGAQPATNPGMAATLGQAKPNDAAMAATDEPIHPKPANAANKDGTGDKPATKLKDPFGAHEVLDIPKNVP